MSALAAILFSLKVVTAPPGPPATIQATNYPRRAADLNRTRPPGFRVPSNAEKWSR